MSSDENKKKIAAVCWKKGSEALAKEQYDYAVEMFSKSVKVVPDNLMYRQSLRGSEHRMYKNNKTGAKMGSMKLVGPKGKIKKARMTKNWEAVDQAAEEGLRVNPWDPQLNADMADACKNLGYAESAIFGYQRAIEADPENKDYLRDLAKLLEERGEYADAAKMWEKVRKLDPMDGEARSKSQQLSADSVLEKGGYQDADTTRDVMSDHEVAKRMQKGSGSQADGPGMSVEADLQRAIRKEPENQDNYLTLADHYKRESKLAEAAEQYRLALEVSGGDANIRENLEDVELLLMRKNVDLAKEAVSDNPEDDTAKENAASLAKELVLREIEVFSARTERYPTDLRIKFELAQRFMRTGKIKEAIPLFQQSSNDPRQEVEALISLGECFVADKKGSLAKRNFIKASESTKLNHNDQPTLFKKCFYYLGRIFEDEGNAEEAENYYSEVLAVDYDYRDTLKRLEEIQESGG